MFCQYCGNELPDGAKFCNNCGKPLSDTPLPISDLQNESAVKSSLESIANQESAPAIKPSTITADPKKKKRRLPLPAILAIIIVAAVGIILVERNLGTQDMVNRTIDYVSGLSEDQIVSYYGDYFDISKGNGGYVLTTSNNEADVTWSGNDVTIKWPIQIKIQRGDQPAYTVSVTLNAETNFMRSNISHKNDWTYSFEVPDRSEINSALPEGGDVVSMKTLFEAFDSNGITAINT